MVVFGMIFDQQKKHPTTIYDLVMLIKDLFMKPYFFSTPFPETIVTDLVLLIHF